MVVKKAVKKKGDEKIDQLKSELVSIEGAIDTIRQHNFEMEDDLREARTMLFVTLGILFAMFGLALGMMIKLFIN